MRQEKVFVIDGSFSTQLKQHVENMMIDGDPLWSARFNATDKNSVMKTHLDFLRAGADVILTNTYQATVQGYIEHLNLNEKQSIELIKSTVGLAHEARSLFLKESSGINKEPPWIVVSIGPYGAYLHDGSEYTGAYAEYITPENLQKWHRIRISAILEAGVDALAIETIPCHAEAQSVFDLMCQDFPDVKFWISFQCKDEKHLASGESFAETASLIYKSAKERKLDNLLAIGVNCLHPEFVSTLFKSFKEKVATVEKIPLICYPNSGEIFDVKKGWSGHKNDVPLKTYVPEWMDLGAKFIGGCCRTNACDIKNIREIVDIINNRNTTSINI